MSVKEPFAIIECALMPETFEDRYTTAIQNMLGVVPDAVGIDPVYFAKAEQQFSVTLPQALRDFYLTLGNLRELNNAHNQLLDPKDWFIDNGKLVFMAENQAVVYWGVEATKSPHDNPPVFQGVNCLPETIDWHSECDHCAEFLLVMLHWQAVMGGLKWHGMSEDSGPRTTEYLSTNWQRVGGFNGMDAYCREGRVACLMIDTEQLYVAGRTEGLFEAIVNELRTVGVELNHL